jgi:hypothetical protein
MTEHQIQSAFIEWARLAEKQDERLELLFAVPNGGKRNIITAMKLKKEGVKAGVLDIFLPVKTQEYDGLIIEFKRPKTGKISQEQLRFMGLLNQYSNWKIVICTSAEDAIQEVKNYLGSVLLRMTFVNIENK